MIRIKLENTVEFPELYKLDMSIVYKVIDGIDEVPSEIVLETLGDLIVDTILEEKSRICKSIDVSDFTIEYDSYNDDDGVISFLVSTDRLIIGEYFVTEVQSLFNDYETNIYYDEEEYRIAIRSVEPMLRYIGSED